MRRRSRNRLLTLLAVAALVLGWRFLGEPVRALLGLPGTGVLAPASAGTLRVATWNLRNFPDEDQDLERLGRRLRELGASVLALQEVHDVEPLRPLLPGWELLETRGGGRGHQRLVVAFDPAVVEVLEPEREDDRLSLGGHVRPALSVRLRGRERGPDFALVVVHLKARAEGLEQRRRQWPLLAAIVEELAAADDDVLVLGDFNATGAEDGDPRSELEALAAALGGSGLRRLDNPIGCTAYWDGRRRDAWKEPSELDLVWVRGLHESLASTTTVAVAGPCSIHRCSPFRSTDAYPEPDHAHVSDHCPVVVDLRADDDEPGAGEVEPAERAAASP